MAKRVGHYTRKKLSSNVGGVLRSLYFVCASMLCRRRQLFESNTKNVLHPSYLCNSIDSLSGGSLVSYALLRDRVIFQSLYVFSLDQEKHLCLLAQQTNIRGADH